MIPDFQSLMLPVLKSSANGEVRIRDVISTLANELDLTEEEKAVLLPSGKQTTIANRINWAKSYLTKAKLVRLTGRGLFEITDRGRRVLADPPEKITIKFLDQFEEFRQFKEKSGSEADGAPSTLDTLAESETPEEVMRSAYEQMNVSLADDLLERIRQLKPGFFEKFVVNLLISMGYGGSADNAGRALGRSGDNGVDGVIDQDALGLDQVYIQAKRYGATNKVGSSEIRDFFGSLNMHKATKGLFVTTSSFTASAIETAKALSNGIVLLDGDQVAALMIRHNVGCRIEDTLHVRTVDDEFFD